MEPMYIENPDDPTDSEVRNHIEKNKDNCVFFIRYALGTKVVIFKTNLKYCMDVLYKNVYTLEGTNESYILFRKISDKNIFIRKDIFEACYNSIYNDKDKVFFAQIVGSGTMKNKAGVQIAGIIVNVDPCYRLDMETQPRRLPEINFFKSHTKQAYDNRDNNEIMSYIEMKYELNNYTEQDQFKGLFDEDKFYSIRDILYLYFFNYKLLAKIKKIQLTGVDDLDIVKEVLSNPERRGFFTPPFLSVAEVQVIDCKMCNFNQELPFYLPQRLFTLDCSHNNLVRLPNLPESLLTLECSHNNIESLPELPEFINFIHCSHNRLSLLPEIQHTDLVILDCDHNELTELPLLPRTLDNLSCKYNKLTKLTPNINIAELSGQDLITADRLMTNINAPLQELHCQNNYLTELPPLPGSLFDLRCFDNKLTALPDLPSSLQILFCSFNQLTSLPELPMSLIRLSCRGNKGLSNLPALPPNLEALNCVDTKIYLNDVSAIPPSLTSLKGNATREVQQYVDRNNGYGGISFSQLR